METDQSSIYFIRYVVTRRTKDAGIAATEPEGTSEMTSFGMVQSSSPETAHHMSFWVETEVRMKSELGEKTILFVQRSRKRMPRVKMSNWGLRMKWYAICDISVRNTVSLV